LPVSYNLPDTDRGVIYQRSQYQKGGLGQWYWNYRDDRILSYIKDEKIILDIGCGEGITLQRLIETFPNKNPFGLDLSFENALICRKFGLSIFTCSVDYISIPDNSIDCCLLLEVIEHLERPGQAISEIHRVLKRHGLLLLIFPNDIVFKIARIVTLKFREAFYNPGHIKQWTPRLMKKLLKKKGFDIMKLQNIPFIFWWCSLHCLVVARKV